MSSDNYLQPRACPKLAVLLTEYPIATSIASHLTTKDLLNLSRTSKHVHQHLAEDMRNFRVIAQYTLCDGKAVLDRKQARGHYIKHPENLQCQGAEGKLCSSCAQAVASRSAINTKTKECRFHILYRTNYGTPNSEGSASAADADNDDDDSDEVTAESTLAQYEHDANGAAFRCNERRLEPDMEARKQYQCENCTSLSVKCKGHLCKCTPKSRFLDRWVCRSCQLAERKNGVAGKKMYTLPPNKWTVNGFDRNRLAHPCTCGKELGTAGFHVFCAWCNGKVYDALIDGDRFARDDGPEDETGFDWTEDDLAAIKSRCAKPNGSA